MLEDILPMALAIIGIYEGTRLAQVALLFDDALGPGWYFFLSGVLFVWVIALLVRQIKVFYGLAVFFSGYLIASLIFFLLAQRIFGERSRGRSGVLGLANTGSFYFVSSYLAGVPFP